MLPSTTRDNIANELLRDAEAPSQFALAGFFPCVNAADLPNVIFCDFGTTVSLALRAWPFSAPLCVPVSVVIEGRSEKQMLRVATHSVIARMANKESVRYGSDGEHPGHSVRTDQAASKIEPAIAFCGFDRASPVPAGRSYGDFGPEAWPQWFHG